MYATYFKPFPTLVTPRLILRRVQKKDLNDLYEYCRLPSSCKYAQWQPHEDRSVTKQYLSWLFSAMRHGTYYTWVIELKDTGKVIGTCSFVSMDEEFKVAEIGYGIQKGFWGNGYATEAVRAVLDYGFTRVGLIKVNARIMRDNLSSVHLAGRVGMSCEGIQRKGVYTKSMAHDLYLFGITDEDYKQLLAENEKADSTETKLQSVKIAPLSEKPSHKECTLNPKRAINFENPKPDKPVKSPADEITESLNTEVITAETGEPKGKTAKDSNIESQASKDETAKDNDTENREPKDETAKGDSTESKAAKDKKYRT